MSTIAPSLKRTRAGRVGAVLAAASLSVGLAVTVGGQAAGASAAGRATTTYTVSKTGEITGKAVQAPGRIAIAIRGYSGGAFQLVRSIDGAGAGRLVSDAAAVNKNGNAHPLERDFLLYGGAPVGQTYWALLKPGDYYALDTNNEKLTTKGVKHIHVTSGKVASSTPPRFSRIQAIGEESWDKKPRTLARSGVIAFQNKAAQSHFIDLERLKPGKTRADITKVFQGKESPKAVFYSGKSDEFDSGVLSPKHTIYLSYTLKPGTWMLACFWPDRKTGMPHAFMGMYRTIKVV